MGISDPLTKRLHSALSWEHAPGLNCFCTVPMPNSIWKSDNASSSYRVPSQFRVPWRAFSLVELLVVVSVIGILAGLLLPALGRAKAKAESTSCLNNVRQLNLGWLLYADQSNDHLIYNLGLDSRQPIPNTNRSLNWVDNIMSWEVTDTDNTNLLFLKKSPLTPFIGSTAGVFVCPSDKIVSDVQRQHGWTRRVRSYSMNAMVGDAGPNVQNGGNIVNPGYRQFLHLADIPNPSGIFVFLDEHPDSIGDGYFYNKVADSEWAHLPGSYHRGAANFSYADGHVGLHRWKSAQTTPRSAPFTTTLPSVVLTNGQADFQWIAYWSSSAQ